MSEFVVALPMYDWPETRSSVDARWTAIRSVLRAEGVDAPSTLVRRNADMPAVAGGIRDEAGRVVAPDPASLPPDGLDLTTLWRHPRLLLGQACWGPMERGLAASVVVVGQSNYDEVEGGQGTLYSSALLMRRDAPSSMGIKPSPDGKAVLPLDLLRGARFAYNGADSMSGLVALSRDLEAAGGDLALFSTLIETGAHRASIIAVAQGRADVCAIDCRSWQLAKRHEPLAARLRPAGWTALRLGLPYITSRHTPHEIAARLVAVLA